MLPTTEKPTQAGQPSGLSVIAGSAPSLRDILPPDEIAEALASQWEEDAEKYRLLARQHYYNPKEADRLTTKADTIEELAGWLRRHMEAATVRQPAPNGRDEGRAGSA